MKRWWQAHQMPLIVVTAYYAVTTLPFLSSYPYNWDAAQFNLALHHFDIGMHQPHPPGYPLFILLGKLFALVLPDNLALSVLSASFGFISVVVLYSFAYRLWNNRVGAVVVTFAWMLNPLFWLYREVALTYTADAAASITLGYLVFLTVTTRQRHYLVISTVVLAVATAIRPSLFVLLLPLWLLQAWYHRRNWKLLLTCVGIGSVGMLIWLLPLAWISGGVGTYFMHGKNLLLLSASTTSLLYGAAASATWSQTGLVLNTILISVNLLLPLMFVGAYLLWRTYRWAWLWLAVWIVPALLTYCLIHFGQLGYALLVTIPLYLCLVPVLQFAQEWLKGWQRWLAGWLGLSLLLLQAGVFLVLTPTYAHPNFFPHTRAELYLQRLARWTPNLFKLNRTAIAESDRQLKALRTDINQYPADETIVIAGRDLLYPSPANGLLIRNDEIFRELSYLLPTYPLVEVAPQRDYYLMAADYTMDTVYDHTITVPNETHYVIFAVDSFPPDQLPTGIITEKHVGYYLGVIAQPWEFVGFTFQREADKLVP